MSDSTKERQLKKARQERMVLKERIKKVEDFISGTGTYLKPDKEISYLYGKQDGKPVVAFDQRHLKEVGKEGRDQIRDALALADKREGVSFIDRSRAMKLERLREARDLGDQYEAREGGKQKDEAKVSTGFKFVDKFRNADNLVRFTIFGLSGIFVILLFRFMFYPLFTM